MEGMSNGRGRWALDESSVLRRYFKSQAIMEGVVGATSRIHNLIPNTDAQGDGLGIGVKGQEPIKAAAWTTPERARRSRLVECRDY
jgi:hypothetical protein